MTLLALTSGALALVVSSVVAGALVPGVVPLVLGRIHELIPDQDPGQRARAWSLATTAFALGQAGGAYGFSFLYAKTGSYTLLFALGGAAVALALLIDLALSASAARPPTARIRSRLDEPTDPA